MGRLDSFPCLVSWPTSSCFGLPLLLLWTWFVLDFIKSGPSGNRNSDQVPVPCFLKPPTQSLKLSAMPDPLTIAATAVTGLKAVFRLAEIGLQLKDVSEDAQSFVCLVQVVKNDLFHALHCRADLTDVLRDYPDHYKGWIGDAILRTKKVLEDFGQNMLKINHGKKITIDKRIMYVLSDHRRLVERERALKFTHTSLLAAISLMHPVYVQRGANITLPDTSRHPKSPAKRASSQRPLVESPESLSPTPDASTPGCQGSLRSEATSAPPRSDEILLAQEGLFPYSINNRRTRI